MFVGTRLFFRVVPSGHDGEVGLSYWDYDKGSSSGGVERQDGEAMPKVPGIASTNNNISIHLTSFDAYVVRYCRAQIVLYLI